MLKPINREIYRRVVFFASATSVVIAALCVVDLFAAYPHQPFAGQTTFDVCFLLSSLFTLFMCRDMWVEFDLGNSRLSRPIDRQRPRSKPMQVARTYRRSNQRSNSAAT